MVEEVAQFFNGKHHKVGDAASVDFHIVGFFLQSSSVTVGTGCFATITGQHHAILYLILIALHHPEEGINAHLLVFGQGSLFCIAVPKPILLFLRKVEVGFKDGEAAPTETIAELRLPFSHFLSAPAHHGAIVDTFRGIRDDQRFVNAHYPAKTFASGTCTGGGIEREHLVGGFFKTQAIGLKGGGEAVQDFGGIKTQEALSVALVEGGLNRVGKTRKAVGLAAHAQTVDEQVRQLTVPGRLIAQEVFDQHHLTVEVNARDTLFEFYFELLTQVATFGQVHRSQYREAGALAIAGGAGHNVFNRIALHFFTADGRIGFADAGKEHAKVVIDFSGGTHR